MAQYADRYMRLSKAANKRRVAQRRRAHQFRSGIRSAQRRLMAAQTRLAKQFEDVLCRNPGASWWRYVELMRFTNPDARIIYRAECEPLLREAGERRKAAINARLRLGFSWDGRPVGGNPAYHVGRFHFQGLVSEQHPILQFFVSKLPRGRRLICGDNKAQLGPAPYYSKLLGCDEAYIEGLKPMRGFLRVEIDKRISWHGIELACRDAGIPPPNIAVGWIDPEGIVWNPHLLWLLENSVVFTPKGKPKCKALFWGILRGLTAALLRHGADPGGISNSMRTKNPLSPLWSRQVFAEAPYNLEQLRAHVNWNAVLPQARNKLVSADHPIAAVAVGSNAMFRSVASWARQEIRQAQTIGLDEEQWQHRVEERALLLAGEMLGRHRHRKERMASAEQSTLRLARSIAEWTWNTLTTTGKPVKLSGAEIAGRQAEAGRQTAKKRGARSRDLILVAARQIAADGGAITQTAVLAMTAANIGSERTIRRHWPAVRALIAHLQSSTGQTLPLC